VLESPMPALTVIFVTHATSSDNEAGVASGHHDAELSAVGREQARELGARWRDRAIDAVYASDLRRSYETAELAFGDRQLPLFRDARLRECDYGSLTRGPAPEVRAASARHIDRPYPGGESYAQVTSSVGAFLASARRRHPGGRIIVVGHRATHYAIQLLCDGTSLAAAIAAPFEWQPEWTYEYRGTRRVLGDRAVHAVGFGGMNLSIEGRPEQEDAIRTIHAALDAGAELIDTADCYASSENEIGHNEALVRDALRAWPGARPVVATKGGVVRPGGDWAHDGRPEHLRAACEASLRALGVDVIDLYQLHAVDDRVPIEDSVGELSRLRDEGKARLIGVSNVTLDQLERASRVTAIAAVQNEASPFVPHGLSDGVLAWCETHGAAFLAYAPTGGWRAGRIAHEPALRGVADALDASPFEVALAWLLAKSPALIALSGATRPENATSSMRAATLTVGDAHMRRLDAAHATLGHAPRGQNRAGPG
jgi:aryl-alcohol dehydrogenase-like predicted oxidoreductase/broad specificity phosphatase PhoE